ncbi:Cdk activating kinase (CAK)/RNA polymerase II transcription initiation/nucleotide excision repair factor TFIIH/TFIIK, kinase subunit CDK7 [Phaffia rhodozyma]|uniref:Cdk activating kinase (CAK)/RNA polymerase II transcription initiation/nucleotide excision repair factor TFIIH/TFIIK, kinase subunit CDK7 n=1 Tax=Phaffia rhodozyma TaxID=264483 RepID=A0A0F7SNI8_PHARH|nr:Cdk activating kinase (CAK)/RNA polymerase II transcription initiation/nucleotide excision repair factor TFIIH/TFIIK, kinase subunit CDK7 [Phaffia rhodozyma]
MSIFIPGSWGAQIFTLDPETIYPLSENPRSTVYTGRVLHESHDGWVCCKTVSLGEEESPHSIRKEARLLANVSHPNIISLLTSTYTVSPPSITLFLPLLETPLSLILDSPSFKPDEADFIGQALSIGWQCVSAVEGLHERRIAHRDIKVENFGRQPDGTVKLFDLGIAWEESGPSIPGERVEESKEALISQVGSGEYRAPELLFSPQKYDPFALDAWSLGVVLAHFFTPLIRPRPLLSTTSSKSSSDASGDDDDDDDDDMDYLSTSSSQIESDDEDDAEDDDEENGKNWRRKSLFVSDRGEIGLAASIFRILGTPTDELWPDFHLFPDSSKLSFLPSPGPLPSLQELLPNLPPIEPLRAEWIELLGGFLRLDPIRRTMPREALSFKVFDSIASFLPVSYPGATLSRS